MTGFQLRRALSRQKAQQGHTRLGRQRGQSLPQYFLVFFAAHMGADHAGKGRLARMSGPGRAMPQKTFSQRRHRLPQTVGIERQQHGQTQQGGQLGRAARAPGPAVIEAHSPFHQQQVRATAIRVRPEHAGKNTRQPLGNAAQGPLPLF